MLGHHFTVDVEEYFQVAALAGVVRRSDWGRIGSRVRPSVDRLLDLLARHDVRGTFFVLGWIAERHPDLVRAIADAGHEVASHGWDHRRVTSLSPLQFRESVRRSKRALEDLTGRAVAGFRAPSFSIVPGREWALDVLVDEGYRYDSSLFPVWRPGGIYGYPNGRRDPHWVSRRGGHLAELPPATLSILGRMVPAAGGGYFRLLPYALTRAAFRSCERRGVPGTFYIHPWELDPGQPRLPVSWATRVRHYGGLRRTEGRLERLLGEFRFTTMVETVATLC
ncbi:MAG TPA: XrtA system polysaccharide deacetylase [Gemmatimonadales bacterium]|nr:XrtA system polysaccharide deacetylase [Gemmatimonadales bacterium]